MQIPPNPESPVPLFHQIAEDIRYRIAVGDLRPGDPLPSIRVAGESLGVHFLTVRKAYQSLEQDGLIRSRRGVGTWVLDSEVDQVAGSAKAVEAFVDDTVRNAWRHGLDSAGLARAILQRTLATSRPSKERRIADIHFVECNQPQAEDYARQVRDLLEVPVGTWLLDEEADPPTGLLLGTYFHFNEIRARWPARGPDFRFLPVHLDPTLANRLVDPSDSAGRIRVWLCETSPTRAHNVMPDLSTILPPERYEVEPLLVACPSDALETKERSCILFSPRLWARLDARSRREPRAILLRYLVSTEDARALTRMIGRDSEVEREQVAV